LGYRTLLFEIRDHVGWLTLNRPDKGNALSMEMVQELRQFFADLEKNLDIRMVVVRGAHADADSVWPGGSHIR